MIHKPIFQFALREDLKERKEFLPARAEPKATGWDVRAAISETLEILPFAYFKIPLGVRMFAPDGWWLELRPRSSAFAKKNINALYGVIDETFESELNFLGQFIPDNNKLNQLKLIIEPGERIGQVIPVMVQSMIVEDISNEEYDNSCQIRGGKRGTAGFGGTGKF